MAAEQSHLGLALSRWGERSAGWAAELSGDVAGCGPDHYEAMQSAEPATAPVPAPSSPAVPAESSAHERAEPRAGWTHLIGPALLPLAITPPSAATKPEGSTFASPLPPATSWPYSSASSWGNESADGSLDGHGAVQERNAGGGKPAGARSDAAAAATTACPYLLLFMLPVIPPSPYRCRSRISGTGSASSTTQTCSRSTCGIRRQNTSKRSAGHIGR